MRSAIIAAIVAALVSSGGTYAAVRINGRAIRPHSIPLNRLAAKLPAGAPGPQGTQGAQGPQGLTDAVSPSAIDYVQSSTPVVTGGDPTPAAAYCPGGEMAIAGGYSMLDGVALDDYITPAHTGWEVLIGDAVGSDVTVYVICEPSS
jgi:hypothetical protein